MDTNNQNKAMAVVTLDTVRDAVKPPPKKLVLLKAAAQVLFEENQKARDKAQKKIAEIIQRRRKFLLKHCRKLEPADVGVASWTSNNGTMRSVEVRFSVADEVLKPFQDEIGAVAMPVYRNIQEFERMLKQAQVRTVDTSGAVHALLADKVIREKLLECGRKLMVMAV